MDHSRHQKLKNKQFKNGVLESKNNSKPINITINYMDKFKKKELAKKKTLTKKTWCDWYIG